ncbi:MAG: AMP-binding protein [Vulcanimicrobiota bacterium]
MIQGRLEELVLAALSARARQTVLIWADQSWSGARVCQAVEELSLCLGPRAGQRVALSLTHSPWMLAAALAILRSGAACVPIEPSQPEARKRCLLEEVGAALMLDQAWLDSRAPGQAACQPRPVHDPAFIFFTSGSSGRPKGVLQTHAQVCRGQLGALAELGLTAADRVLARVPISTSGLACDLAWAWLSGATLVLADESEKNNPELLSHLIRRECVSVLCLPPSFLRSLLAFADFRQAAPRLVICAGEKVSPDLWRELPDRLAVIYGTTEVPSACYRPPGQGAGVGRAMAGKQLLCHEGEIYLGGAVAEGYWGQPELTAERFVWLEGRRWYRTGDRGQILEGGWLELDGRLDEQMQIRGHRLEPSELEAVLREIPGVSEAVVGERRGKLVAWLSGQCPSLPEVREFCRLRLPDWMLPERVVAVQAFQRNAGGKLDRLGLPDPPTQVTGGTNRMLTLFRQVLQNPQIQEQDNFFQAGGNSLLAANLMAAVEKEFGVRLPLTSLLSSSSAQLLSQCLFRPQTLDQHCFFFHRQGAGPTLVCVHPIDGELLCYRQLAEHLRGHRPVLGLRLADVQAESIPALAALYLDLLQERVEGPLHLLGYSAGASIALEMALQWLARGGSLGWLGVVDLPAPGSHFWDVRRMDWPSLLRELPFRWRSWNWRLLPKLARASRLVLGLLGWRSSARAEYRQGSQRLARALQAYSPSRTCPVTARVFRSPVQPLLSSHAADLGWSEVCQQVEVIRLQATHEDLLSQPELWQKLC